MVVMRKNDQSVDWSGVKSPGMVSDVLQLENTIKHPDDDNDDECDDVSVASSNESRVECDGAVVLNNVQEKSPCFQNIEVTNSSDVHFGNKTYYQGPVTIKQILYTNPSQDGDEPSDQKLPITDNCGTDNNGYIPDPASLPVRNGNINNSSLNNNVNWTEKTKGHKWLQARTKRQIIIGTLIAMLIVLCAVALTVALLITQNKNPSNDNDDSNEENEYNVPNNSPEALGSIAIVSRREWVAEPPHKTAPLPQPISSVIITETKTQNCSLKGNCIFIVRHLQTSHIEGSSSWDIKYNFLVGGDGNVYEGRGWKSIGASIPDCSKDNIGIAFIGTFSHVSPPSKQIIAARRLIGMGIKLGHIKRNYQVVAASQILGAGEGSNLKLDKSVQTWPHWSNNDYVHNDALKEEFCNNKRLED